MGPFLQRTFVGDVSDTLMLTNSFYWHMSLLATEFCDPNYRQLPV